MTDEKVDDELGTEENKRKGLESVIGDLLRKAVERGIEKAQDAPENLRALLGKRELPKEMAGYVFSQVEETKEGLFRVVAKETRDFLEHANLSGELKKFLTSVKFEINTSVRFVPNEASTKDSSKETNKPKRNTESDDNK